MMKILVADKIADKGIDILRENGFEVDVITGKNEEELIGLAPDYDAIIVRSQSTITRAIIEAATKLKIIGRAGVGVDNVDIEAATEKGIIVCNVPAYSTGAVAQFVFALLLLAIYAIIVFRGISVAMNSRSSFHGLLSFGIIAMLGYQTLLIVGGNIRLIPLTGVTLPFVAEGGSSMVSYMAAIGLLLGVSSLNADADEQDRERAEWQEDGLA